MSKLLGAVFPGQGSQQVGMLAGLAAIHPQVGDTFQEASAVLGYDLWQLVQTGPAEQLALTHITQPAILASSVAIWRVWQAQGGSVPVLMAGHSLGEYSALVCSGALDFAEAVALVRQRGEFMQSAVPVGTGGMAAIVGLDDAAVVQACAAASTESDMVAAVNFNSPGQVVIAGHAAAVNRAGELCKAAGAKRALPLPVSAPFHSPLMQPAAERFAAVLADVAVQAPAIPVIQNFGLASTSDPAVIRRNLVSQIYNPVPWVATIQQFAKSGIGAVIEFGPGKVLCGLNKRIDPGMEALAVNEPDNLQAAIAALQLQ
jgi:[acyl-carrier-protein] S-malonyltransferase